MDHAHHKGVVESSVELGNYTGLVGAVLAQVSAGLYDHTTNAEGDVHEPAAKRLKDLSTAVGEQTPARRAMAGRFALGADDVMYLQNAVSVLAAGHERGSDEIPIAPGEMLSASVVESVRRIVEEDMRAREIGRLAEAPGKLEQLAVSVGWLLQLDEVREGVNAPDLIVTEGPAYKRTESIDKMKEAVQKGGDALAGFQKLLLQLYAMLNDDYAPGRLANEIEEAMRKSARDVDSARKTMHEENLKFLRTRRTELEKHVATLTGDLKAAEEQLKRVMGELEASNDRNSQLVKQVQELKVTVRNQGKGISRLRKQIAELEGRLAFKEEEIAELNNIVDDKNDLIDTLRAKLEAETAKVSSLSNALNDADQEIAALKAGAKVDEEKIAQRDAEIATLEETHRDLQMQIAAAKVNESQLTREIAAVEEELEACKKDLATAKAEVETAQETNKQLMLQVAYYEKEQRETLRMLGEQTKKLSEKDERIEQLTTRIQELEEERAEMRAAVEELANNRGGEDAGGGDDQGGAGAGGGDDQDDAGGGGLLRSIYKRFLARDSNDDVDPLDYQKFVSGQSVDIGARVTDGENIGRVGKRKDSATDQELLAVFEYARVAVEATQPLPEEAKKDDLARYVEYRGLVGQRGPEEPRADGGADAHLPYSCPWEQNAEEQNAEPGDLLFRDTATEHHAVADAPLPKDERQEALKFFDKVSVSGVLSKFKGDFALIPVPRDGDVAGPGSTNIERSFCARWRPVGPQCAAVAKAAALEHAAQRCVKMGTLGGDDVRVLLKATAGALKLRQLESLFEIHEHIEDHGGVHTVLPGQDKLVTRPLAQLRRVGKLCFPIDCGLHRLPEAPRNDIEGAWLNKNAIAPDGTPSEYTFRALSTALQDKAKPDNSPGPPPAVFLAPEVGRLRGDLPRSTGGMPTSPTTQDTLDAFVGSVSNAFGSIQDISNASELSEKRLRGLIRLGLSHCESLLYNAENKNQKGTDPIKYSLPAPTPAPGSAAAVRGGLWKEMLRELAISNDRLWIFVRTFSGSIGEDASSLLSQSDDETQRAQRAIEAERKAVAERVAAFQSKIVEILVSNLLRTSKLEVLPDNGNEALMVLDGDAAKQMRDLASGESGRPFFEANVAMQAMLNQNANKKLPLAKLVQDFNTIVASVHTSLSRELEQGITGASGSLAQLAEARNSYFVSLRPDVCAAIRSALDRFHHEIGSRRPCLWELVEGASSSLSLRFAELVGHVLVQTRNSTGASALYISAQQQAQTAMQARVALLRLVSEARYYLASAPVPNFADKSGRDVYFGSATGNLSGVGGGPPVAIGRVLVSQVVVNSDVSGWQPGSLR